MGADVFVGLFHSQAAELNVMAATGHEKPSARNTFSPGGMLKFSFGSASHEFFNPSFSLMDWICLAGLLPPSQYSNHSDSAAPVGESSQAVDAAIISRI